ncbi:MAG: acyl-CoA dehydrogenase family protein, partial [Deltaproteobacteria bacterium]
MDLNFTDSENAFRKECRAWLEANVPSEPLPSGDTKEGFALHLEWEHKLFDAGWAAVSWPKQYGGREATLFEWLIFEEEYYRVGAPSRVTQNGIFLLAPTLFEFGTDEQKERFLGPFREPDRPRWACLALTEPGAGSDAAAIETT